MSAGAMHFCTPPAANAAKYRVYLLDYYKGAEASQYFATASNGFGIHTPTIASGTPVITATWHYREE